MEGSPKTRSIAIGAAGAAFAASLCAGAMFGSVAHAAGAVSQYVLTPSPIAPNASLAPGATVAVTLTAEDSSNAPVPNATVYLSFVPASGGGSATGPGSTPLPASPMAFSADAAGRIAIAYKSPATLPATGRDTLHAQNAASKPTVSRTDTYTFNGPTARYKFSPTPIGGAGTLAASTTVSVSVSALTNSGSAIANATIFLSLTRATGGGSASVGTTALTSTPASFTASGSGVVSVAYTTPATLPTTGTDVLVAQNAASSPSVHGADAYSFGSPTAYALVPTPIAPTGTLVGGAKVTVTLTVSDGHGNTVAGAKVDLFFAQASGGGSATAGGHAISASGSVAVTDSQGRIVIVYTAPATPPSSGSDTVTAKNSTKAPTITASDSYTF